LKIHEGGARPLPPAADAHALQALNCVGYGAYTRAYNKIATPHWSCYIASKKLQLLLYHMTSTYVMVVYNCVLVQVDGVLG